MARSVQSDLSSPGQKAHVSGHLREIANRLEKLTYLEMTFVLDQFNKQISDPTHTRITPQIILNVAYELSRATETDLG